MLYEIETLTEDQWVFADDTSRWSIAEITEHLVLQNLLHYRELSVAARSPQHIEFRVITDGMDDFFTRYATDATKGKAQWYLQPLGKYESVEIGKSAFSKARRELIRFVSETKADLRKHFTYRTPVEDAYISELKIGQVRDLHQLLLTGIAHTDRHLRQIRQIKAQIDYPD